MKYYGFAGLAFGIMLAGQGAAQSTCVDAPQCVGQ